jgi:hypothetical protein
MNDLVAVKIMGMLRFVAKKRRNVIRLIEGLLCKLARIAIVLQICGVIYSFGSLGLQSKL